MSEEETKITDGEKWRLQAIFEEFYEKVSFPKRHLNLVRKNTKEEIHIVFDKFKDTLNRKSEKRASELKTEIDELEKDVNEKITELEKKIAKINFWISSVKWFFGILLSGLCVFGFTLLGKKLG